MKRYGNRLLHGISVFLYFFLFLRSLFGMLIASTLFAITAGPLFTRQINRKQWHCSVQAQWRLIVTLLKSSFSEMRENSVWCAKRAIRPNSWWISEDRYYRVIVVTKAKKHAPWSQTCVIKNKTSVTFIVDITGKKAGWASMLFTLTLLCVYLCLRTLIWGLAV